MFGTLLASTRAAIVGERHVPLWIKFAVLLVGPAAIVFFAIVLIFDRQLISTVNRSYEQKALLLATTFEADMAEHPDRSWSDLQFIIDQLQMDSLGISEVNIYAQDATGRRTTVVASSRKASLGRPAGRTGELPVLTGQKVTIEETNESDQRIFEAVVPMRATGRPNAALGLHLSLRERDSSTNTNLFMGAGLAALFIAFGLFSQLTAMRLLLLRPIGRLAEACLRFSAGDYSHRIPTRNSLAIGDELEQLAHTYNRMCDAIEDQHQRLQVQATHDGLTGLLNHRELHLRLEAEVLRAERYGRPCSLLILDLDGFKQINDRFGHPAGDEILKHFARHLLPPQTRSTDMVARYGGDEFAVIMPETRIEGALQTAGRIRTETRRKPCRLQGGEEVTLSVSIGIACWPNDGADYKALVMAADQALYVAKRLGSGVSLAGAATGLTDASTT